MEKTKSVLDHMKSRLGMYVPVQDGKPTGEVWGCLLREIIQGGIASFRRGEATRIEICTDDASGSFTVSYDGISYSPENLFAMCNGTQTMFTGGMVGFGWYHQQYKYIFAGDSAEVTIEPDGPLGKSLGADVNRCWMELFKEYVA